MDDTNKVIILGIQHRCDACLLVGQCFKCPHFSQKYVDGLFQAAIREANNNGRQK